MKKYAVLVVVILALASSASAAGTTTGSLQVLSTVSPYLNLTVTNSPITVTFTGDGTAGSVDRTASLNIMANKPAWTVTFTSAHSGVLNSSTTGVNIPYYLQASGTGVVGATMTNALSTAVQLTAPKAIQATVAGKTPMNGVSYTLTVTVAAQAGTDTLWQAATDYMDTITIAITAP